MLPVPLLSALMNLSSYQTEIAHSLALFQFRCAFLVIQSCLVLIRTLFWAYCLRKAELVCVFSLPWTMNMPSVLYRPLFRKERSNSNNTLSVALHNVICVALRSFISLALRNLASSASPLFLAISLNRCHHYLERLWSWKNKHIV
jgi:hypothetical protein